MSAVAQPFPLDLTPPRLALPRSLTWMAAFAYSLTMLVAGMRAATPAALLAAAALIALTAVFVFRPLAGLIVLLLTHQSVDLWANGQLSSIGGLQFNLSTGMTILAVVVGGAYLIENRAVAFRSPSLWAFVAFTAVATASLVFTPSLSLGLSEVLRLARVGAIYGLVYALCRSRRDLELIAASVLLSISGVLVVALHEALTHGGRHNLALDVYRTTGGFYGPDELGFVLGALLCFAIPLLLGGRLPWWPLLALWAGLTGVALVNSYTRTAWISLAAGLLAIGVVRYRSLLVFGPLIAIAVVVAVPSTVNRFSDLNDSAVHNGRAGNTFAQRVDLWRANLPKVNSAPVLGHGFASIDVKQGYLVHSDYVRAAVETGLVGVAAFAWLVVSGVVGSFRAVRRTLRQRPRGLPTAAAVGAFGVAVIYLLASADSNLMTKPVIAGSAWALIACGHAMSRLVAEERSLELAQ
jgi:putative inorganic carbon (HCO3(-)) transporter